MRMTIVGELSVSVGRACFLSRGGEFLKTGCEPRWMGHTAGDNDEAWESI